MEKRLGIAQLCIMVAVLVFMALTRGSRGESMDHAILPRLSRRNGSMDLSGEWTRRPRIGSNPTPSTQLLAGGIPRRKGEMPIPPCRLYSSFLLPHSATSNDEKVEPSPNVTLMLGTPERTQHRGQNSTQTAPSSLRKASGRARTPQARTPKVIRVSTTPSLRPNLTRVNSQSHGHSWMSQSLSSSVIAPVPKSVKRWARTAHVHEIKRKNFDSGASSQSEAEIETPNDSSSRIGWSNKGKRRETDGTTNASFVLGENHSRRGSFGRSPLRPTTSTNVNVLDTEATDPWVDTDEASSSETDIYLNRTKGRLGKSTDALKIHHQPPHGIVGVGAS
jgi:hypothetical protein